MVTFDHEHMIDLLWYYFIASSAIQNPDPMPTYKQKHLNLSRTLLSLYTDCRMSTTINPEDQLAMQFQHHYILFTQVILDHALTVLEQRLTMGHTLQEEQQSLYSN